RRRQRRGGRVDAGSVGGGDQGRRRGVDVRSAVGDRGVVQRRGGGSVAGGERDVANHRIAAGLGVGERERVEMMDGAGEREARLRSEERRVGGGGGCEWGAADRREREGAAGEGLGLGEVVRAGDGDGEAVWVV